MAMSSNHCSKHYRNCDTSEGTLPYRTLLHKADHEAYCCKERAIEEEDFISY